MKQSIQQFRGILKENIKDKYQILEVLGIGTFGKVYLVKDNQTNELYALKNVLQNKKYKNRQLEIMLQLDSDYIVRLNYYFYVEQKQKTFLNLVMQYLPETLSKIIKNSLAMKEYISTQKLIGYARCLLKALADIHKQNICHRDIKPSNILINDKVAKLCDFGSAKILSAGQKNISYICSRYYRAPELLLGAVDYSLQVDIWSLGCVIAEMMINRSLFEGADSTSMLIKIAKIIGSPSQLDLQAMQLDSPGIDIVDKQGIGLGAYLLKINPECNQQVIRLVEKMVLYNPEKRITALQALLLPLFND